MLTCGVLATQAIAPPGVVVAVGVPSRGAEGFRRSHLAARDAARVGGSGYVNLAADPVVLYREVGLIALLSTDPERAAWFGAEELGELTGIGPADVELRRTALCYLEADAVVTACALLRAHHLDPLNLRRP
jgi:hypothetical protein